MAETGAGLAARGGVCKFVGGRVEKGGGPPIDRLVDGEDRQWAVANEVAAGVDAANFQVLRRNVVRRANEGLRRERRAAPRTGLEGCRRAFVLTINVPLHPPNRSRSVCIALAA